jgi:hypothetical protein
MSESKTNTVNIDSDEDKTITISHIKVSARSQNTGMTLDLGNTNSEAKGGDSSRETAEGVQEDEILVVFELPDLSQGESKFKFGQTVEVLKSYVESEFGIPMQTQVLKFKGKTMMDPLSLLDFPEAKGSLFLLILCCFN